MKRLLRALVLSDSFVYVVGGMSDTAGHGNLARDSYPAVMHEIMAPVMEKVGSALTNQAVLSSSEKSVESNI